MSVSKDQRGFVVLGDPGAGKTTHLKRVLLAICRKGPESLGLPKGMVPVFLPLRELNDWESNCAAFIQAQLGSNPELDTSEDFGEKLMERGNLLLLLDGLDEVSKEGDRVQISRWLENALASHPDCRFVLTCRFVGYGPEVRLNEHFLELHIRPLSDEESEKFVRNWYRIVECGSSLDQRQAEVVAKKSADELMNRLRAPEFRARRVSELTANPLLLTNLCLVHRDRGELPKRRSQLYSECIDVFLERWRKGKKMDTAITADIGRRVLQPAALWLHTEEGRTRAKAEALGPVIEPVLKDVKWTQAGAKGFLKTVRDESGLLTGWGDGTYGFMHLGFQEYLAALEVRRKALSGEGQALAELAEHFGESWWQEVILLLLAIGNPSQFTPFMNEVLKQEKVVEFSDLVDACLDDAVETSVEPFLALVQQDPADNTNQLWSRQLTALQILERMDRDRFESICKALENHPSEAIRNWLSSRDVAGKSNVFTAEGKRHLPRGGAEFDAGRHAIVSEPSGVELVRIPAGSFLMGAPEGEEESRDNERPQHEQRVDAFYMGRYPVTNEQYSRFLEACEGATKPGYWDDRAHNRPNQPVVGVSLYDAKQFCDWAGLTLPSEVEWEYACRAGTTGRFCSGDANSDLDRVGWYSENSGPKLHPVGQKAPNDFGLYDMHGNVWEWTRSRYGKYPYVRGEGFENLENTTDDDTIMVRGGAFHFASIYGRSAFRLRLNPNFHYWDLGFRVMSSPF